MYIFLSQELKNRFNYFSRKIIYLRQATTGIKKEFVLKMKLRKLPGVLNQLVNHLASPRTSLWIHWERMGGYSTPDPWMSGTHLHLRSLIIIHYFIENFQRPICYFDHLLPFMFILCHSVIQ